jgi:hypothetical protein
LGHTSYGDDSCALGPADNNVVSLGDSGYAIVKFDIPISDGPGFDFAVFENAFDDEFLELAFKPSDLDVKLEVRQELDKPDLYFALFYVKWATM